MDLSGVNLLDVVVKDVMLKKVSTHNGGEWAGECPFCGGHDRFRVWPFSAHPGWWCRQCDRTGDAISYIEQLEGVAFGEACSILGLTPTAPQRAVSTPSTHTASRRPFEDREDWIALTDPDWARLAHRFVNRCCAVLHHEDAGQPGREYLLRRGLSLAVAAQYSIGYLPVEYRACWGSAEVFLPAGIVIPWYADIQTTALWKVNVRRLDGGSPKYLMAKGSANGLFGVDQFWQPGLVAVLMEGELDALAFGTAMPSHTVIPLATGSTQGARLKRWISKLALADQIVLAFDSDKAGHDAAAWWQGVFPDAVRRVPTRHDVNDMVIDSEDVSSWIGGLK
jgi:DNA primase